MAFVTGYSANIGFGFTTLNNWSNRSKRARCFLKKKKSGTVVTSTQNQNWFGSGFES